MKPLRNLGLFLFAVALSATFTVSAQAAKPQFFRCVKQAGKYDSKACSKEGAPKEFERKALVAGETESFRGVSNGVEIKVNGAGGKQFTCQSWEIKGEVEGPNKAINTIINFIKCRNFTAGTECGTGAEHEITTNKLKGELVYLKAAKKQPVGLVLEAVAQPWVQFTCGLAEKFKLEGAVIGELEKVNEAVQENFVKYKENAAKEQEWTKVEEAGVVKQPEITGAPARIVTTTNIKWACPNMGVEA